MHVSGPAAAPMAGFASKRMDVDNVIMVDMGGTSFDVSLVTKGATVNERLKDT